VREAKEVVINNLINLKCISVDYKNISVFAINENHGQYDMQSRNK
jgi:hypothetical protein